MPISRRYNVLSMEEIDYKMQKLNSSPSIKYAWLRYPRRLEADRLIFTIDLIEDIKLIRKYKKFFERKLFLIAKVPIEIDWEFRR